MKKNLEFSLLCLGDLICCLGLSIIAPFYPTYAEKFDISGSTVGLIFSIFPVGGIIASLIIGKLLNNSNTGQFLAIGMFIQTVGLVCYSTLSLIENKGLFIALSFLGRFISGFGAQTFLTPLFAAIPKRYRDSIDEKMAIAEFFSAFGFLCGPVIGSLLYSIGGFSFPFLVFACFSILIAIILKFFFGKNDQVEVVQDEKKENNVEQQLNINEEPSLANSAITDSQVSEIGYLQILRVYSATSCLQVIFALLISYTFFSPIMSKFFKNTFDIPPENVGYYMITIAFAYSISALILSKVKINKVYGIFVGVLVDAICQFFMGPDPLLGIAPNIYITMSAQFIYGFFHAPAYIYILPQTTEVLEQEFEKQHHAKCISLASGLFNAAVNAGELIGPSISGLIAQYVPFERSCSYVGLFLLLSTLIFMPNIWLFKQKKQEKQPIIQNISTDL